MFWTGRKQLLDKEIIDLIKQGGKHKETAIDALNRINIECLKSKFKEHFVFNREDIQKKIKQAYNTSLLLLVKEVWKKKAILYPLKNRFKEIFNARCDDILIVEKIKLASKDKEEQEKIIVERFAELLHSDLENEISLSFQKKAIYTFIKIILKDNYLQQKKGRTLHHIFSKILKDRLDDEKILNLLKEKNDTEARKIIYEKLEYQISLKGLKYNALNIDDLLEAFYNAIDHVITFIRKDDFRGEAAIKTIFDQSYNWKCLDIIRKNNKEKKEDKDDEIENFDRFN